MAGGGALTKLQGYNRKRLPVLATTRGSFEFRSARGRLGVGTEYGELLVDARDRIVAAFGGSAIDSVASPDARLLLMLVSSRPLDDDEPQLAFLLVDAEGFAPLGESEARRAIQSNGVAFGGGLEPRRWDVALRRTKGAQEVPTPPREYEAVDEIFVSFARREYDDPFLFAVIRPASARVYVHSHGFPWLAVRQRDVHAGDDVYFERPVFVPAVTRDDATGRLVVSDPAGDAVLSPDGDTVLSVRSR